MLILSKNFEEGREKILFSFKYEKRCGKTIVKTFFEFFFFFDKNVTIKIMQKSIEKISKGDSNAGNLLIIIKKRHHFEFVN